MKRKRFLAVLTAASLSASMALTAMPVFAGDVVSVEASDANAYGSQTKDDAALKTAIETKLASLTGSETITTKSDSNAIASALGETSGKVTIGTNDEYQLSNFAIQSSTTPSYRETASGGELVMPVITVKADVMGKNGNSGYTTAYGTCTFTLDATKLIKSEQITAAKAIIEGAGGKTVVDLNADKYSNDDNSDSLADYVKAILDNANIKTNGKGTPAASSVLNNITVDTDGKAADGTTKTAGVTQSAFTAATKSAAGSETVNVAFKITLSANSTADPDWDSTKSASDPQNLTGSASYTVSIKKLGITSNDSDYQARVEAALKDVKLTNTDFKDTIAAGNYGATFTANSFENAGKTTVADNPILKALNSVGLDEDASQHVTITYRSLTPATHKSDGSVTVLLDQNRSTEDTSKQHAYATVTIPVVHATDVNAVEAETSKAIDDKVNALAKDAKDISVTSYTEDAQVKELEKNITAQVNGTLASTLDGTNTIASEIDKVEVKVDADKYTQIATAKQAGTLGVGGVIVTVTYKDEAPATTNYVDASMNSALAALGYQKSSTNKKQVTYTSTKALSIYRLEGVDATNLTLNDEYVLSYTGKTTDSVTVTPNFTPANANTYKIRWTLDGDNKDKFTLTDSSDTTLRNDLLENQGVKVAIANGKTVKPGDEVTLKAELIDDDNLVAATAKTTVKVVKGFVDVQNPHFYAYDAINNMSSASPVFKNGHWTSVAIIEGVGDNKFDPNDEVTRAQFVTFLYRLAQKDGNGETKSVNYNGLDTATQKEVVAAGAVFKNANGGYESYTNADGSPVAYPVFNDSKAQTKFTDVDSKAYYAKAVDWAVANGIAEGVDDTHFNPNGKVTRAQAVTFLYRYYAAGQSYNAANFEDVKSGSWFANSVGWASSNGVTQGKDATHFAPNDTTTRAEAAAFIYRATSTAKINK